MVKDSEKLYPLLNGEIRFFFDYAQALSKSGQHERSNDILKHAMKISCDPMLYNIMGKNHQMLMQYEIAEEFFMKAANMVPNRLYPLYLLMNLYKDFDRHTKAIEMAKQIIEFIPKVESSATKQMKQEAEQIFTDRN